MPSAAVKLLSTRTPLTHSARPGRACEQPRAQRQVHHIRASALEMPAVALSRKSAQVVDQQHDSELQLILEVLALFGSFGGSLGLPDFVALKDSLPVGNAQFVANGEMAELNQLQQDELAANFDRVIEGGRVWFKGPGRYFGAAPEVGPGSDTPLQVFLFIT